MPSTNIASTMNLEITPEERDALRQLVEECLSDTRVEVRRTETQGFRRNLHHEEQVLRDLSRKLKELK